MDRLKGKRCLVTAAGQGIGRAIAIAMAAEGARVLATDVNADALAALPATDGLTTERLDVLDPAAVAALAARLTDIDVLANCAGYVANGTILDTEEKAWAFSFDLNVTAMFRLIRAFLPAMLERGGGSIVNIASVASSVVGVPSRCAYGASKAAVIGLTKSVAADFVTRGVRCNCICPGTVESPSLHERMRATGDYEAAQKTFAARQPMGRLGRPEEIAAVAVHLASDESAFTTGTAMIVDGGWTNV
ncbi:SDR family oxidoreductase [Amaricoccus sp.]|uniref:SDR family oxidoreductase n=1 Tax=Amaricoccus sp. TaxID=1872485 RepID=UPI0026301CD2|nr:SDR family oxidoreductase [Amaricoccus sp.]HRO11034.1 SDR family oxidoreductase [Amaricoccus sp.]